MNIKLLRRIQKQILKEPGQFVMDFYFHERPGIPNCGTAACIGGWAYTLTGRYKKPSLAADNWYKRHVGIGAVSKLLKISKSQASRLCVLTLWPAQFQKERVEGTTPFARQAARRIDHFIKTKGAQ